MSNNKRHQMRCAPHNKKAVDSGRKERATPSNPCLAPCAASEVQDRNVRRQDSLTKLPLYDHSQGRKPLSLGIGHDCGRANPFISERKDSIGVMVGAHEDLGLGFNDWEQDQERRRPLLHVSPPSLHGVEPSSLSFTVSEAVPECLRAQCGIVLQDDNEVESSHELRDVNGQMTASFLGKAASSLDLGFGSLKRDEGSFPGRGVLFPDLGLGSCKLEYPCSRSRALCPSDDHVNTVLFQQDGLLSGSAGLWAVQGGTAWVGDTKRAGKKLKADCQHLHALSGMNENPGLGSSFYKNQLSPLNPRLPWPRFEPQPMSSQVLQHHVPCRDVDVPPTQKFRVHLQEGARATPVQKREWQSGGLNGGDPSSHQHSGCCLCNRPAPNGWWLYLYGRRWTRISLEKVRGRTIRQERESLGLGEVDTTRTSITVYSGGGSMRAKWNYKFPHSASDVVIAATHIGQEENEPDLLRQNVEHASEVTPSDTALCGASDTSQHKSAVSLRPGIPAQIHLRESTKLEVEREYVPGPRDTGRVTTHLHHMPCVQHVLPLSNAVLFSFVSGNWKCANRVPHRAIAQVLEEKWGISHQDCVITLQGRCISGDCSHPRRHPYQNSRTTARGCPCLSQEIERAAPV